MVVRPALVCLTAHGCETARKLAIPEARVHGLATRVAKADVAFLDAGEHLRALFRSGVPIVGVCAAGVLIRSLAPLLADKRKEPPVVAVAEDGSAVAPLLGGHRGANALARDIARQLGVEPAITTAGDRRFGVAVDDPPPGWRVANPAAAKPVSAALLAGKPVRLVVEAGDARWLDALPFTKRGALTVHATDRAGRPGLVLHPPTLALGVGCERGCAPDELIDLARATLAEGGWAAASVACVVSLDLKADEPAVHALAAELQAPARFFDAATLERETPRLANPSEAVFREVGCHGVAEAAALAAVGGVGELVAPKRKSARATCAVARRLAGLEPQHIGRPRGRLAVIGVGPGSPEWRTREAEEELARATDVVGYTLYLDLVADLIAGKPRHDFALGEEEKRAAFAIRLADEGRKVALVSSGDAGIFAMASLVFEQLERKPSRAEIVVAPGVSALQAAAARAGAPLGHDFCAISLSDLLTPWAAIERRLRAAAEADFVIALYNPASRGRREPLERALTILRAARAPQTPVVVARNLGRPEERVEVAALSALEPASVDMLTLLIVGASTTRSGPAGVFTPRGYPGKVGR